nr:hypothetical protein CFP56_21622 [Quercus suber]
MPSSLNHYKEPGSVKRRVDEEEEAAPPPTPPATAGMGQAIAASDNIVAVLEGGDVVLCISGLAGLRKPVGLRCSSHILTMTSPVFKTLLADAGDREAQLHLPEDDGDALLLLCNLLHLRNDALPSRLPADLLYRVAVLADKYDCSTAAGRATMGWFDGLLRQPGTMTRLDLPRIIQAAYFLNEPTSFVRFTERWVLCEGMGARLSFSDISPKNQLGRRLVTELHSRRQALIAAVRADLDLIVDPCSLAFSDTTEHYIDYMPGMTPEPDGETGRIPGSLCYVDSQCGTLYLGALRDSNIWPPTVWPSSLEQVVQNVKAFEIPEYDDCDKCEFCEDVKAKFAIAVGMVKQMHNTRLWGLCLDCFKAGGAFSGGCSVAAFACPPNVSDGDDLKPTKFCEHRRELVVHHHCGQEFLGYYQEPPHFSSSSPHFWKSRSSYLQAVWIRK